MKKALLEFGIALLALAAAPAFASTELYVSTSGYVGIGTTSPAYPFDALGGTTSSIRFSSGSTDSTNFLLNNTTTGGQDWYVGSVGASQPGGESAGDFHIGIPGTGSWLLIDTAGDVSIPGTLTVTGIATLGNGSTAVTQTAGDNSTKIATDAFVQTAIAGAGHPADLQTFTSSGTWTKPGFGTVTFVQCWGAGGSGSIVFGGNAGGGGGGYEQGWFKTSALASTVSVTVGSGGERRLRRAEALA